MTREELDRLEWKHNVLNRINPQPIQVAITTTYGSWHEDIYYTIAYPITEDGKNNTTTVDTRCN